MAADPEISHEPEHWKRPAKETRHIYFRRRYMCIAKAIDLPAEVVMAQAAKFERAAFCYQHDGLGVLRRPADGRKELQKISRAAERVLNAFEVNEPRKIVSAKVRLLKALEVENPDEAIDGPSFRVCDLLFYADTVQEDEIILATEHIGSAAALRRHSVSRCRCTTFAGRLLLSSPWRPPTRWG